MRKILLYFSLKYNGDYTKIYNAIKEKEVVSQKDIDEVESKIKCKYVTMIDNEYPSCLRKIGTPPFVLFYYGDISLLSKNNKIAIIGKRENSEYGKLMCEKIINELDKSTCIVSGLAIGIDGIAHNLALKNNLSTIAILGNGIDYIYPYKNKYIYDNIKKNGLLISEYPFATPPVKQNFLIRNRIIAALVSHIVVIEASFKSGTMNTVTYGLEFGKEICCVPYLATYNSGCNKLIQQGAKLIECAADIFE